MKHFFKWFAIAIAVQLVLAGVLFWTRLGDIAPLIAFVYAFYYIPAALVLAATAALVPDELLPESQFGTYIYGFAMVIIFYSLIVASIAHFVRNFRRPVLQESIAEAK